MPNVEDTAYPGKEDGLDSLSFMAHPSHKHPPAQGGTRKGLSFSRPGIIERKSVHEPMQTGLKA
nr:hypothetical protein [Tanacetum cinerariifolium]